MFPIHRQIQTPTRVEFLVPITSGPNEFISVWDTSKLSFGSSGFNQVHLPLQALGTYNFMV
ncbi:MAG: hypothetical protein ACFFG0_30660, partial [Candidatus Thorarchaeota archaeon]